MKTPLAYMEGLRYLSVCSGIEAASHAWEPLGWSPIAFSEIDDFPRRVLRYRYPDVPLFGDFTAIRTNHLRRICGRSDVDVLVGGTPCQSFSVAGLRRGLDDDRGNLALQFLRLARRTRPRWVVWENVPGVLSSTSGEPEDAPPNGVGVGPHHVELVEAEYDEGADFVAFAHALAELGYGVAYRTLDAQYVRVESHPGAVPQRRRRVFVVGHLGDWRPAVSVLFEPDSLHGHPEPRRGAGQGVAPTVTHGPPFSRTGNERVEADALVVMASGQVNAEITCDLSPALNCNRDGAPILFDTTQVTSPANYSNPKPGDPSHPLAAGAHPPAVAVTFHNNLTRYGEGDAAWELERTGPLKGVGLKDPTLLLHHMAVRRLTPRECERLQGYTDDWTLLPDWPRRRRDGDREEQVAYLLASGYSPEDAERFADCPDGPRYKALGNSMAVNVMRWIGSRIQLFETLTGDDQ